MASENVSPVSQSNLCPEKFNNIANLLRDPRNGYLPSPAPDSAASSTVSTTSSSTVPNNVSSRAGGGLNGSSPMPSSTSTSVSTGKAGAKRPRSSENSGGGGGGGTTPELMRCKRRINFAQLGYNLPQAPPTAVARRNERERNRVKLVNLGFATLREHVPNGSKNKKMSKVETLRSAVEYIRKLQELLDDNDGSLDSNGSPFTEFTDSGAGSPATLSLTENMVPSFTNTSPLDTSSLQHHYHHQAGKHGTGTHLLPPPSSVSPTCSVASSPTPSYASDCSYEPLSPEEEDLLDFTSWFTT